MKAIVLCLLALLIFIPSAYSIVGSSGIQYSYDDNQFRCWEDVYDVGEDLGTSWSISISSGSQVLPGGTNTQTVAANTTNFASADISGIPCGQVITCTSTINGQALTTSVTKQSYSCPQTQTTVTNINITTGTNWLQAGAVNYGTIPYNISSNLPVSKIFGLSTSIFLKLSALLIITILVLTILNLRLALVCVLLAIIFFSNVASIIIVPGTLLGLILVIVVAYAAKGFKI